MSSNFNNRGRFEEGGEWIKSSAVVSSGVVVAMVLVVRRFRFGASGALSFRTTYGVVSSSCGKTVFCAVRFGVVGGGLWLCCLVTLVGDLRFCRRKCEVSWSIVGGERGSFVFLELFGVAVGRACESWNPTHPQLLLFVGKVDFQTSLICQQYLAWYLGTPFFLPS